MKPYEIIDHIIDDLLCSHFKDDYCLTIPKDTRFDNMRNVYNKHSLSVHLHEVKNYEPFFFHNNNWIQKPEFPNLRKVSTNNFFQHSWEPVNITLNKVFYEQIKIHENDGPVKCRSIILHSELNSKDICELENRNIKNIYWFSHAYICSEFYFKHYQKLLMVKNYKARPILYKWLSANRLLRSHRIELLEQLDLSKGCYSLLNPDPNGLKYTGPVPAHSFDSHENHSAEILVGTLSPWNTSFLHIVTETVWQDKIHFTEKIFKPIVMHQPFVVVQAPGSLKYLQSYGFKTFGDWWDESYDDIQDPTQRLQAIAKIINDIGSKDISELEKLRMEMAGVLEHNFHHFYENIPAIVLGELENNIRLLT